MTDRVPSKVQSVAFPKDAWTAAQAKAWLAAHSFRYGTMDDTGNFYRFRQHDPKGYASFGTVAQATDFRGKVRPFSFVIGGTKAEIAKATKGKAPARKANAGRTLKQGDWIVVSIPGGRATVRFVEDIGEGTLLVWFPQTEEIDRVPARNVVGKATKKDVETRETIRGMLRDWNAATPAQRKAATKANPSRRGFPVPKAMWPAAISIRWLPANQAWGIFWHDQPLAVKNTAQEVRDYFRETWGVRTGDKANPSRRSTKTKREAWRQGEATRIAESMGGRGTSVGAAFMGGHEWQKKRGARGPVGEARAVASWDVAPQSYRRPIGEHMARARLGIQKMHIDDERQIKPRLPNGHKPGCACCVCGKVKANPSARKGTVVRKVGEGWVIEKDGRLIETHPYKRGAIKAAGKGAKVLTAANRKPRPKGKGAASREGRYVNPLPKMAYCTAKEWRLYGTGDPSNEWAQCAARDRARQAREAAPKRNPPRKSHVRPAGHKAGCGCVVCGRKANPSRKSTKAKREAWRKDLYFGGPAPEQEPTSATRRSRAALTTQGGSDPLEHRYPFTSYGYGLAVPMAQHRLAKSRKVAAPRLPNGRTEWRRLAYGPDGQQTEAVVIDSSGKGRDYAPVALGLGPTFRGLRYPYRHQHSQSFNRAQDMAEALVADLMTPMVWAGPWRVHIGARAAA